MKHSCFMLFIAVLVCVFVPAGVYGLTLTTYTIDFEDLADLTVVTDQYASKYVTFDGAQILTAGSSLNTPYYPPHSGDKVVRNYPGDAIWLDFAAPVYEWEAYFTYYYPVTINAYDASNTLLGTISGTWSDNTIPSGNPPNELLSFSYGGNIGAALSRVEIVGVSNYLTMDDMSFGLDVTPIPEPSTMILFSMGLAAAGIVRRRRK